jgi:catechol 2,3-dioxygenase-like lactoylglutathione lyase family enzyme
MAIELNHTIVHAKDAREGAAFLAELFGLPAPEPFGPFMVIKTANGVSLDYIDEDGRIARQHYAFLVSEEEFDRIWGKIKASKMKFWADPAAQREGEINRNDGGRGLYFRDPSGHFLEIITRPYGSGGD